MNICFFCGDITEKGGTERVCAAVSAFLSRRGYNVCILSVCERAGSPRFELDGKITRHSLRKRPVRSYIDYYFMRYPLRRFLCDNKTDVIIDVDSILDIVSLPASRKIGARVVSWDHFAFDEALGTSYRLALRRLCAPKADAVVTLTEGDRDKYNSVFSLKSPAVCIRNPLAKTDKEAYNIDSRTILSCGAVIPIKGFDRIAAVAAPVFEKHPDWSWIVLGDGSDRARLTEEIKAAGLDGNVAFEGFVPDTREYFAKSAIFALTSRSEGLPMVLLEAKAASLPVVAFDVGAATGELLRDSENAFIVPQDDTAAYSAALCALIEDEMKRKAFSDNARAGLEEFSPDYVADRWEELLSGVLPPLPE